jgi:hypothetical protein
MDALLLDHRAKQKHFLLVDCRLLLSLQGAAAAAARHALKGVHRY